MHAIYSSSQNHKPGSVYICSSVPSCRLHGVETLLCTFFRSVGRTPILHLTASRNLTRRHALLHENAHVLRIIIGDALILAQLALRSATRAASAVSSTAPRLKARRSHRQQQAARLWTLGGGSGRTHHRFNRRLAASGLVFLYLSTRIRIASQRVDAAKPLPQRGHPLLAPHQLVHPAARSFLHARTERAPVQSPCSSRPDTVPLPTSCTSENLRPAACAVLALACARHIVKAAELCTRRLRQARSTHQGRVLLK